MDLTQGMFAMKLYEMNQQYGRLQGRIRLCQSGDHDRIRQEIRRIRDESLETELLLQTRIESSSSPVVARLARAQMDYVKTSEDILRQTSTGFQPRAGSGSGDVESAALYAEYAMDFAAQAMRHALLASLHAMDAELTEEEQQAVPPWRAYSDSEPTMRDQPSRQKEDQTNQDQSQEEPENKGEINE